MGFEQMRSQTGKLLAEVDPRRRLMKFKVSGRFYFVDLDEYLARQETGGDAQELRERIARLEQQFQAMQNMQ